MSCVDTKNGETNEVKNTDLKASSGINELDNKENCCAVCGRDLLSEIHAVEASRNLTLTPKEVFFCEGHRCWVCSEYYNRNGFDRRNMVDVNFDADSKRQGMNGLALLIGVQSGQLSEEEHLVNSARLLVNRFGLEKVLRLIVSIDGQVGIADSVKVSF